MSFLWLGSPGCSACVLGYRVLASAYFTPEQTCGMKHTVRHACAHEVHARVVYAPQTVFVRCVKCMLITGIIIKHRLTVAHKHRPVYRICIFV